MPTLVKEAARLGPTDLRYCIGSLSDFKTDQLSEKLLWDY